MRGHRDDWTNIDGKSEDINHGGNFHAVLQFQIDVDHALKQHLQSAGRNAVYSSKGIQNEFINICGKLIRNKILQKVNQAAFSQSSQMRQLMLQMLRSYQLVSSFCG